MSKASLLLINDYICYEYACIIKTVRLPAVLELYFM